MPIWRYYAETPEAGVLFGQAMTGFTAIANAGILGSYKFNSFAKAVDVGGGHGSFLFSILEQQPNAIDPKGRLAVVEIVLPPQNEPHLGPLIDLNMMVMTGGAERTETGYRELLARAGFRVDRVVATKSPFSVIEAVPQ